MAAKTKGKGVEVGVGYISIVPSTRGFAAQLKRDLNPNKLGKDIGRDLDRGIEQGIGKDPVGKRLAPSKDSVKGVGSQLDSMLGGLKRVAIGAAVAGGAIVAAGVDAFKAYSDQNEAITKAQQVFGDQFERVDAVARNAARTMGISRATALDTAATFGNLFRAMGVAVGPATDMSLSLEQLAADLGSFNNVPTEDALMAIRSGLVGEVEPMRRFGANINQARLEAEALSLGLVHNRVVTAEVTSAQSRLEKAQVAVAKATKEHGADSMEARTAMAAAEQAQTALDKAMRGHKVTLDAAQKAQAAYSLIMKDTAIAQGDYARTAEGAANKTKTLGALWQDFKANVGEKLAPLGMAVLGGLETALTWLNDWWVLNGDNVIAKFGLLKDKFLEIFGPDPAQSFKDGLTKIQEGLNGIFGEDKVENFRIGADIVAAKMDEVFGPDKAASLQAGADTIATEAGLLWDEFERGAMVVNEKLGPAWDWLGIQLIKFKDEVLDPLFGTWLRLAGQLAQEIRNIWDNFLGLFDLISKAGEPAGRVLDILEGAVQAITPDDPRFEHHDAGGVIGGPVGAPRTVVAHGGETVLPTHRPSLAALRGVTAGALAPAAAAGPLVGSLTVNGQTDPAGSAWAMRRELRRVGYYAGSTYL